MNNQLQSSEDLHERKIVTDKKKRGSHIDRLELIDLVVVLDHTKNSKVPGLVNMNYELLKMLYY